MVQVTSAPVVRVTWLPVTVTGPPAPLTQDQVVPLVYPVTVPVSDRA